MSIIIDEFHINQYRGDSRIYIISMNTVSQQLAGGIFICKK